MPTYEYACRACSHEFEVEQSIKDKPISKCPKCGRRQARRMITQGNFILKGGGWYADLYSSPSQKKPEADSSQEEKDKKDKSSGEAKSKSAEEGTTASKAEDKKPATEKKPSGGGDSSGGS